MQTTLEYYAELVPTFMIVGALAIVFVEWTALAITHKVERHREGVVNILCGVLSFIPVFILARLLTVALMFWLYEHRVLDLGLGWFVWILGYVAFDLTTFLVHLVSHKVRLLWCAHSTHHAPKEIKASVSFRGSFADFLVTPQATLWLPLLGFHPLMLVILEGLGMIWGVVLHLNEAAVPERDSPWLRSFLITPAAHRLHHARNSLYLDTNYGLTFSLWDRLIGSLQRREARVPPEFGVRLDVESDRLLPSQLAEFAALWADMASARRPLDKLGYLFMPPGWRPTDGGETARELRRRALAEVDQLQRADQG